MLELAERGLEIKLLIWGDLNVEYCFSLFLYSKILKFLQSQGLQYEVQKYIFLQLQNSQHSMLGLSAFDVWRSLMGSKFQKKLSTEALYQCSEYFAVLSRQQFATYTSPSLNHEELQGEIRATTIEYNLDLVYYSSETADPKVCAYLPSRSQLLGWFAKASRSTGVMSSYSYYLLMFYQNQLRSKLDPGSTELIDNHYLAQLLWHLLHQCRLIIARNFRTDLEEVPQAIFSHQKLWSSEERKKLQEYYLNKLNL